jgi:nitrate reductase alpha subunit
MKPGTDLDQALVRAGRYLRRGVVSADLRTLEKTGGREADSFYRDRWSYDKVVRPGPDRRLQPDPGDEHGQPRGRRPVHTLIGAPLLSFYDWYADLPVASPQVFGDQTDVPESGDWWDASYLILWGSNVPVTRTPDAHWITEARYRGQKVVVCSPDYSDAAKFADEWLSPAPGTDGALAMAMGHVILREFLVDRQVPYFADYLTRFTDAPFLVTLEPSGDTVRPGKFLTADALGEEGEHADFKPVMLDGRTGQAAVPGGSLGFRFGEAGLGRWNLDLGDIVPLLTMQDPEAERVAVDLPRSTRTTGPRE